nr:MAG TPA: hypothetical protein [Caudoviricetes sp.]
MLLLLSNVNYGINYEYFLNNMTKLRKINDVIYNSRKNSI